MIKKHISPLIIIALMLILLPGCDNTDATLTELWRVKAAAQEYISETYAFDSTNSMIMQGMKFDVDGNEIYSLYKINSAGQTQWSMTVANWGMVKVDKNNNIFHLTYKYDTTSRYAIAKYSPTGLVIWQKNDLEALYSISIENDYSESNNVRHALDPEGNLFIQGQTGDQFTIIKINQSGNELWRRNFATKPFRMISDSAGNVYVGCTIAHTSDEGYDLRVLKLDGAAGALLWDRVCLTDVAYGEIFTSDPLYMMVDNADNPVIVRHGRSAIIDKFSPSGDQVWNYTLKPTDLAVSINVDSTIVKFDSNNNAIVSAVVSVQTGRIPMPTTDMTMYWPLGYQYCRLIKLDTSGKKAWSKKVSNIMIVNGDTKGQLNVDRENNIYVFCNDNALMKYSTKGKKLWEYTPEVTNVSMGQLSKWHVDSDLNLYWVLQCGAVEMVDYGYWITKYSQE